MHTKYSTIVDYAKRLKMQNIVKKRGLCGPRFLLCFYRSIFKTNWANVSDKPNYLTTDEKEIVFGYYSYGSDGNGVMYPALRKVNIASTPVGDAYGYTCYYFDGTRWTTLDKNLFTPGI